MKFPLPVAILFYLSNGNRSGNNENTLTTQRFTQLRPTEKSSMMHRARLPPSSAALPTTDGRLSHNAVRSQMPTEEVTNPLQVSVPLGPWCVHMFVCVCVCDRGQRASCLQGEESVIDSRGQPAGRKCHRMLNGWVGTEWHKLLGQMQWKPALLIMDSYMSLLRVSFQALRPFWRLVSENQYFV